MGYEQVYLRATALVSRHNSERDRRDDELWKEFLDRVRLIANEPRYQRILLDVAAS